MELQAGALIKVGTEQFEFVGFRTPSEEGKELQAVGRLNPDQVVKEGGALHRTFPVSQLEQDGIKIGPFCEVFPYSSYITEKLTWESRFKGSEQAIVHPPTELVAALLRGKEQGIENLTPHYLPQMRFTQENVFITIQGEEQAYSYPEDWVQPESWFFEQIGQPGGIPEASLTIPAQWVLIDATKRPDFTDGTQLYPQDPLAQLITQLEQDPNIPIHPSAAGSRFGISWDDRAEHFDPLLAKTLGVTAEQATVRVPTEEEFNVLGNLFHKEFGQTTTSEWLNDKFGADRRLDGGLSDFGGLAFVFGWLSDVPDRDIGFRPLVAFLSKP